MSETMYYNMEIWYVVIFLLGWILQYYGNLDWNLYSKNEILVKYWK